MKAKEVPPATRRESASPSNPGKVDREMGGAVSSGDHPGRSESPITLKMRNAGRAWEELNAMPSTPPPLLSAAFDSLVPSSSGAARAGRKRSRVVVITAVVVGLGLGLGALGLRTRNQNQAKVVAPPSETTTAPAAPKKQAAETVSKPDLTPDPVPAALPHEKQRIGLAAQPARVARPRKVEAPPARARLSSPRPAQLAPEPTLEPKPTAKPAATPVEEFGMDLAHPHTKRRAPTMDEKDPYVP
jgi:hypothetical protein